MKLDIEKLKKFEKLPPDVKRQLALYMSKWKEKKKESKKKRSPPKGGSFGPSVGGF